MESPRWWWVQFLMLKIRYFIYLVGMEFVVFFFWYSFLLLLNLHAFDVRASIVLFYRRDTLPGNCYLFRHILGHSFRANIRPWSPGHERERVGLLPSQNERNGQRARPKRRHE